jgi:hypothetical protein
MGKGKGKGKKKPVKLAKEMRTIEYEPSKEMRTIEYEPLLPVEKKLISWSLILGIMLLNILIWVF